MAPLKLPPLTTRFTPLPAPPEVNTVPLLKLLLPEYWIVPTCASSVPPLVMLTGLAAMLTPPTPPTLILPAVQLIVGRFTFTVPEPFQVAPESVRVPAPLKSVVPLKLCVPPL